MPLHDHFHPPVSNRRHWSECHGQWPGEIVRTLFDRLPPGFYAGPRLYLGSSFEVDVSVAEDDNRPAATSDDEGGTATLTALDPPLTFVSDLLNFDEYEVRIYDDELGRTLVAAIEIVSPSNKDRPESRAQFAGKCAALLQEGVSVSIIDIVTERHANLFVETLARLRQPEHGLGVEPPSLYAVTLRARRRGKKPPLIDAWFRPLTLGQPLPTVPLWLSPDRHITLPLEPSYQEVCRLLRIA